MIIEIDESFKNDYKRLKNSEIEKRVIKKIESLENISKLEEVSNLKKMSWFNNFYRIRIWDYRVWLKLEWNKIILLRIRSRKDIYNIFP